MAPRAEKRNACKLSVEKPERKSYLEVLDVDGHT